jgi:mRNA-degrading endonuclease toxin of MazEF toxin-antitoxin module
MPLPTPEPGLVVCYEFLWSHEHAAGADEGSKRRPCAIIVAATTERGQTSVVVAPITHREPDPPELGIEVPAKVKAHLGLDAARSWIVLNELNTFVWPGVDLHPVPGRRGVYAYGLLPPRLFEQVRTGILAVDRALKRTIRRTE